MFLAITINLHINKREQMSVVPSACQSGLLESDRWVVMELSEGPLAHSQEACVVQGWETGLGKHGNPVGPGCTPHTQEEAPKRGSQPSNAVFVSICPPLHSSHTSQGTFSLGMELKLTKASPCCGLKQIFAFYNFTVTFKTQTR